MRAAQISAGAVAKVVLVGAVVVGGLYLLFLTREVIGLLLIAIFFALAIAGPVEWLDEHRVPRWAAILLVYLGIGAAIFGVGMLIVPPLVDGINDLSEDIPGYIEDLRENSTFREYDDRYDITGNLEEEASELPSRLGDAAGTLRDVTVGVFSSFIQLFSILVITFFLLIEGKRLLEFFFRQLPAERERRLQSVADDISDAISGYVFGNFVISVLAGTTTYITLALLDVPFAIPLAITFTFFDLIPLVGATIGGALIGIVVAFTSPVALVVWLVVLIVYQQIENNLVQPYVYGQAVQIHPLVVIIAILVGAALLGILGALIAIPAAAALQSVVRDYWAYSERNLAAIAARAAAAIDPEEEGKASGAT